MRFVLFVLLAPLLLVGAPATAASIAPAAQMESFFKTLQAKKYDGALQAFFAGSLAIQHKPQEMKVMEGQIKAAFDFYGPPTSWETVKTSKLGKDLIQIKLISKHNDEAPLFWSVLFYRRHEHWEPIGIYFFDDPMKAGFW